MPSVESSGMRTKRAFCEKPETMPEKVQPTIARAVSQSSRWRAFPAGFVGADFAFGAVVADAGQLVAGVGSAGFFRGRQ